VLDEDRAEAAFEPVSFVVCNARPINSKSVFALVDVEMQIAEISFSILGVQARRLPSGGAVATLPAYRDTDGQWRPAIEIPEELRKPLFDAVMEFLVDEGLAQRRDIVPLNRLGFARGSYSKKGGAMTSPLTDQRR
jgi:hypothetical protein